MGQKKTLLFTKWARAKMTTEQLLRKPTKHEADEDVESGIYTAWMAAVGGTLKFLIARRLIN